MAPYNHTVRNGDPQPKLAVQCIFCLKAWISCIQEVIVAEILLQTVEVSGGITKSCSLGSALISINGRKVITASKAFRDFQCLGEWSTIKRTNLNTSFSFGLLTTRQ